VSLAKITLIGHLGREAETSVLPSGTTKVTLSVAVNRRVREGEPEQTDWYRCSAFGKYAESLDRLAQAGGLDKGRQVYVTGRMEPRLYEKDGETRLSLDVYAEEVQALGPRPGEQAPPAAQQPRPRLVTSQPDTDIDEIPF